MFEKRFADIGKDDIEALVANATPEGRTIEYKRELPSNREEDKKEFFADVLSLANASGGDLIFGIEEARDDANRTTGIPKAALGVSDDNADQVKQRLENLMLNGIEPRINGVQIKPIPGFLDGPVYLLRVPKSWAGPHLIRSSGRFFSRNNSGKFPLDVTEIRAAFLHSQEIPERIRQFRNERIGRILAGETPVPLRFGALTVLHLVPIGLWATGEQIDMSAFVNGRLALPAPAGGRRPNLDGYLGFAKNRDDRDGKSRGYAQLFRHGAIEFVDRVGVTTYEDSISSIPSESVEKDIVHGIQGYMRLFSQMDLTGEIVVFLSMLGVRNCYMATGAGQSDIERLQQDNLLFPELIIADTSETVSSVAKPLLDHVWQAFGFPASLNYFNSGEWRFEGRR